MRKLIIAFALVLFGCGGGGVGDTPQPTQPQQKDVVVFVPGGGWVTVSPPGEIPPEVSSLSKMAIDRGMGYVQLDYPTGECCLADSIVAKLTKDLRTLQNEYRKVFVVASSAGTTPVVSLMQQQPDLVDGFVGLCGIYDLTVVSKDFQEKYSGRYTDDPVGKSPVFSPIPKTPMLLWHSTGDSVVPYTQSTAFSDANTRVIIDPTLEHCLGIWDAYASKETFQWISELR